MTTACEVREEVKRLLPPSARDREIFERVAGQRDAQAAVAKAYGLTQARVSQIVEAVRAWLAEATAGEAGDLPPQKQLRLGSRVVRMRLECLLTATMDAWRSSMGSLTTTKARKTAEGEVVERVTRPSFCDVKYLTAYRHVALALARLDGVPTGPKVAREETSQEQSTRKVSNDQIPMTNWTEVEGVAGAESDLYVAPVAEPETIVATTEAVTATCEPVEGCTLPERPKLDFAPRENAAKRAYKKSFRERRKQQERAARRSAFLQDSSTGHSQGRSAAAQGVLAGAP